MSPRPQFTRRHPAPSGDEIDALRKAAGLSMPHLARLIGVSAATVENWVYGRYVIPEPIWRLAKIVCKRREKWLSKGADAEGGKCAS